MQGSYGEHGEIKNAFIKMHSHLVKLFPMYHLVSVKKHVNIQFELSITPSTKTFGEGIIIHVEAQLDHSITVYIEIVC